MMRAQRAGRVAPQRGGAKRRVAALGAAQRRKAPPEAAERRAANKDHFRARHFPPIIDFKQHHCLKGFKIARFCSWASLG